MRAITEIGAATAVHAAESEGRIFRAARWYAEHRYGCPRPVVQHLCRQFDLRPKQAIEAIRHANAATYGRCA